jgi:ferrous iron transport protein B
VLELPTYKVPALRTALYAAFQQGKTFLQEAGTVILGISVVMWWLSAYPAVDPPDEVLALQEQAEQGRAVEPVRADGLLEEAAAVEGRFATSQSFAGRIGRFVQPIYEPLGYDWQLTVGVLTSFLAREVFVSTMAVLITGVDDPEDAGVVAGVRNATRDDGSPLFTSATAASLLVFFVLAMQCLPTLAVTRRETGGWRWAGLQFAWMSGVAWVLAFFTYQALRLVGVT